MEDLIKRQVKEFEDNQTSAKEEKTIKRLVQGKKLKTHKTTLSFPYQASQEKATRKQTYYRHKNETN
jgi:hypothetical protein